MLDQGGDVVAPLAQGSSTTPRITEPKCGLVDGLPSVSSRVGAMRRSSALLRATGPAVGRYRVSVIPNGTNTFRRT